MNEILSLELADLADTFRLGTLLAAHLFPNAVVALVGDLGAGKTHLTRAIALGLGIADERWVTSPTFVLIQEYPARLPITHFDAYRLSGTRAFRELGADEYFEMGGVCLIEWADRVRDALPEEYLEIRLEAISETSRHCALAGKGGAHGAIVTALRREWPAIAEPT